MHIEYHALSSKHPTSFKNATQVQDWTAMKCKGIYW